MRRMLGFVAVAACVCVTAPAWADLTLTQTVSGKAMGFGGDGQNIVRIKGQKMRSDITLGDNTSSSIMDVANMKIISLNAKAKEAEVFDMNQMSQQVGGKIDTSRMKVSLTPTSATKQVAGYACTIHDSMVSMPFSPAQGMNMTLVITGPVCISKTAPGKADYAAFYLAAAEKNFFLDPRQAKAAGGQAKAMLSLYKATADAGLPLESTMTIKFEGEGPAAAMMSKMGGQNFTTVVTKIGTETLGDDQFTPPADYKVKQNK